MASHAVSNQIIHYLSSSSKHEVSPEKMLASLFYVSVPQNIELLTLLCETAHPFDLEKGERYAVRSKQDASNQKKVKTMKRNSPPEARSNNNKMSTAGFQVLGQPPYHSRYKNFKPLHERSGVMKCRALDVLVAQQSHKSADAYNETGKHRLGRPTSDRGLNLDERETMSKSRAATLSAQYELSDTKNTDLNRRAIIRRPLSALVPSLNNHMQTIKHAVKVVSQENNERLFETAPHAAPIPEPCKAYIDTPRLIREKLGFPVRNDSSAYQYDERGLVQNAGSRDDSENRIPNFAQYDRANALKKLAEKPQTLGSSKVVSRLSVRNNQIIRSINMKDLPELC